MTNLMKATADAITKAQEARLAIRHGLSIPTAGMARGMTQANMISLPRDWAFDFLLYAQRNPKSCPILDVCESGSYRTVLAKGADLRTDIPLYRVWENGKLAMKLRMLLKFGHNIPILLRFLLVVVLLSKRPC